MNNPSSADFYSETWDIVWHLLQDKELGLKYMIFKFYSVLFWCDGNSIMIDLQFLLLNVLVSQYP